MYRGRRDTCFHELAQPLAQGSLERSDVKNDATRLAFRQPFEDAQRGANIRCHDDEIVTERRLLPVSEMGQTQYGTGRIGHFDCETL